MTEQDLHQLSLNSSQYKLILMAKSVHDLTKSSSVQFSLPTWLAPLLKETFPESGNVNLVSGAVQLPKNMQHSNDGDKPYAHDQNSVRGHLAPCSLIGVELEHGTGTTSSSSTACGPTPAKACSCGCGSSGRCITIGHHLVLVLPAALQHMVDGSNIRLAVLEL
jgi:hypothetical protein